MPWVSAIYVDYCTHSGTKVNNSLKIFIVILIVVWSRILKFDKRQTFLLGMGLVCGRWYLMLAVGTDYKILTSPDPLEDEALIDHPQETIWIDPRVGSSRFPSVIRLASAQAHQELDSHRRRGECSDRADAFDS